jgi:DNA transposition AAA+ family ATPase
MSFESHPVNSTIAPLRNVSLFSELVQRVVNRTPGLPGMACFYGKSGYGKTHSAIYAANRYRAYHVQVKSVWTRKKLCAVILQELGIQSAATIPDMVDQIGQELSLSQRPLIIDEADFLVAKGMIEVIRDIYESSQGTIVLIGEENLPQKLKKWERVHGRMLDWVQAQPASQSDARHLASLFCRGIEVADDLLAAVHDASAGSVRRICVNLDRIREQAEKIAPDDPTGKGAMVKIGRANFTGELFTGNPPPRRP